MMPERSLCSACPRPGLCCRVIHLSAGAFMRDETDPRAVSARLATERLPFSPLWRSEWTGWALWCPNLGMDGRCTDYPNRPDPCRVFEPGEDWPCSFAGSIEAMSYELTAQWSVRPENGRLSVRDPRTGRKVSTHDTVDEASQAAVSLRLTAWREPLTERKPDDGRGGKETV